MKPIPSTAEILHLRTLNRSVNKRWVDWAYDMLVAGFDTDSLVMLAGETEFSNQFEMQSLADKALHELNLKWDNRELVIRNYACYIIEKVLNDKINIITALDILKEAFLDLNYENYFHDFYLLYHAKRSLDNYGFQHYWDGATRENIDAVIKQYFIDWKARCE